MQDGKLMEGAFHLCSYGEVAGDNFLLLLLLLCGYFGITHAFVSNSLPVLCK